ncbi:iron-hydroxamate ABC transporter substrate-binding protein [Bacillus sonorensis]|uniref:iron-hydroxamate ABC transporter substrate-binding protein n=1 Tax=Bacillus sonorensis TaxID=119858 RepID=UPI00049618AF|nr:iron-hydroxamate ABC transporter substrate-binding protein [Bacillus sonorensis]MBG9914759.1 iron(3+)-hydroxamate-binding protein yxeB [Bacillus sonorensis]MCF7615938.1 iron-hydroxamate ABC transporter substrate-binding protein [Bacillus sonorensis]MCY7858134.1 iron-hydroxamate ABC transporter substrate-binding protein [Bacillus sonorensis]MCY8024042.1 iron-hydroxamate ABC transporter substrate-binding protein [Bacillus sonorensis]MCY8269758.1 iron-hydroxamate ABC transporter substrate-bind
MKKYSFIIGFVMILCLFVSACSSSSESSGSSGNEKAAEAATRTYKSTRGNVKIPVKPKRIVTDFYAGELFSVGANVVGSGSWSFTNPFLKDQLKDVTDVGDPINVEKVMKLKPDLIVVMKDDNYDKLSKIAPTVVIPYNTAKNVQETVKMFGDIAGAKEQADKFLADFEKQSKAAQKKIAKVVDKNATFGVYENTDKGKFWVFNDNGGRGGQAVYNALGLKAPEKIVKDIFKTGEIKELSTEVIPEYAADYMFVTDYNPNGDSKTLDKLKQSSIWKNLDAVKNNRVFINDFNTFYPYDPISVSKQVDLITEMLVKREKENQKK